MRLISPRWWKLATIVAALAAAALTAAGVSPASPLGPTAYVPTDLLASALANPDTTFQVILQGSPGKGAGAAAAALVARSLLDDQNMLIAAALNLQARRERVGAGVALVVVVKCHINLRLAGRHNVVGNAIVPAVD